MLLKIELSVLKEEWKSLQRMLNEIISSSISDEQRYFDGTAFYGKVYELYSCYYDLAARTRKILESAKEIIKEDILPRYMSFPSIYDSTYGKSYLIGWKLTTFLNFMAKECSKTLTLIDELTKEISLAPREEAELKKLEEEIKAKIEPLLPKYSSELLQSIKSLRKGEFLGSTLICGRIVEVIIDKCKKKLSEEKRAEVEWKDVIEFLRNKGILSGKEAEKILDSVKIYRNRFAHEIGTYPSIEETLLIISGTSLLVKKIAEKKEELIFLFY